MRNRPSLSTLSTLLVLALLWALVPLASAAVAAAPPTASTVEDKLVPDVPSVPVNRDFGHAVAVSGDTYAMGYTDPDGHGVVHVYHRVSQGDTRREAELRAQLPDGTADGAPGDLFGMSLAVNEDTLAVGAPGRDGSAGAVYVFTREGSAWSISTVLRAVDGQGQPDQESGDRFGAAVALVMDGPGASAGRLVVGTPGDDTQGEDSGAVHMFTTDGQDWSFDERLTATTPSSSQPGTTEPDAAPGDAFGSAVSMTAEWLLIGSPKDDDDGVDSGSAYLMHADPDGYFTARKLRALTNDGAPDGSGGAHYGHAVAIHANDSHIRAVVGAPLASPGVDEAGLAYAHRLDGPALLQTTRIARTEPDPGDHLGWSVAAIGVEAVIGAPLADPADGEANAGIALHVSSESVLDDHYELVDGHSGDASLPGGGFGSAVAMTLDHLLIGAPFGQAHEGGPIGLVRSHFHDAQERFEAEHTFTADAFSPIAGQPDRFGASVALDGDIALVGRPGDDGGAEDAGSASIYQRQGDASWVQAVKLTAVLPDGTPEAGAGDTFGTAVALSGTTAAVSTGESVYVFDGTGGTWDPVAKLVAQLPGGTPDPDAPTRFGDAIALDGTTIVVGSREPGSADGGAAYVFRRVNDVWTIEAKLTGQTSDGSPDPDPSGVFGWSVAVSGDSIVVGAPDICFQCRQAGWTGSAYVFTRDGATWPLESKLKAQTAGGTADEVEESQFGAAVAIDGDLLAAAAPGHEAGSVYTYQRVFVCQAECAFGGWDATGKLEPTLPDGTADGHWAPCGGFIGGTCGDRFGDVLALEGTNLLVGSPNDDDQGTSSGSAYLFSRSDQAAWDPIDKLQPRSSQGEEDGGTSQFFGDALAISGTGAVVGMPEGLVAGHPLGSAYVFRLPNAPARATAVDDAVVTDEDAHVDIAVLANDTPGDDGPPELFGATKPVNGTAVVQPDDTIRYTPDADFCTADSQTDDFTYVLVGGSTATVSVTVVCADDPPVAVDDQATVEEDAATTLVTVLANDTDIDGGPATVETVSQPAGGSVAVAQGGTGVGYTPTADVCTDGQTDDFTYTLNGGSTATVAMTVTCVDDPGIAADDGATVSQDSGATTIMVLANDTDIDSALVVGQITQQPPNGDASIVGGGEAVDYTPDAFFCTGDGPTDDFTYALADGATATVRVTVTCLTDLPPTASDDQATTVEDSGAVTVEVLANDSDVDGGPMTVEAVSQPAGGSTTIATDRTSVRYTPDADACTDGGPTDDFTYTLNGGSTATVAMTVTCVDDPAVAVDDEATVHENSGATTIEVVANDTDVEGDPIRVESVTQPTSGDAAVAAGGASVSYTPDADACTGDGPTDDFTYTLEGGSVATVAVTVTCEIDPTAVADTVTVEEDSGLHVLEVLANDTDADGGQMVIEAVTQPAGGTTVVSSNGTSIGYGPDDDYCTPDGVSDSFTYTLNGGSTATVELTVTCVNDPAVATDDAITIDEDAPTTIIDVLANDADPDDPYVVTAVTQPASGTTEIGAAGAHVTYTPVADACTDEEPERFTYTLTDGATADVSVTVTCVDDLPEATDDAFELPRDADSELLVLVNDTDVDDGPMVVESVSTPDLGTVTISDDGGSVFYAPPGNRCGSRAIVPSSGQLRADDRFTYTLNGGSVGRVIVQLDDCPSAGSGPTNQTAEAHEPIRMGLFGRIEFAIAWSNGNLLFPSSSRTRQSSDQPSGQVVLLGREDLYADSLVAGGAQGILDAPLLLTDRDGLHPDVAEELERLRATEVILLGGPDALSPQVERDLTELTIPHRRIGGQSRIETAAEVARSVAPSAPAVVLARAHPSPDGEPTQGFADALTAGALAAQLQVPLLLTDTRRLSPATADYLAAAGTTDVIVVGGPQAVSATVLGSLRRNGMAVERVSGADRFDTAVEVAAHRGFATAGAGDRVILIDGTHPDSWASAFAAARFSAAERWPIVLSDGDVLPESTAEFLQGGGVQLICASTTTEAACDEAARLLG